MTEFSYTELSDEELFVRVKQNDRAAFSRIYLKYWKELLDAAYKRLGSLEHAEETVQDLFVSLYVKRQYITITTSLRAYLHTALKYKILNEVRTEIIKDKYRRSVTASPSLYQPDASEKLNEKELQLKVSQTLKQLPEKCRLAFMMSREDNLSYRIIAEHLGVSVNTVEKHIGKALRIMRANLIEYHAELLLILTVSFYHF